jgi:hypothetical protein
MIAVLPQEQTRGYRLESEQHWQFRRRSTSDRGKTIAQNVDMEKPAGLEPAGLAKRTLE